MSSFATLPSAEQSAPQRRWPWLLALFGLAALVYGALAVHSYFSAPQIGLVSWYGPDGRHMVAPTTRQGIRLFGDAHRLCQLHAVNGHRLGSDATRGPARGRGVVAVTDLAPPLVKVRRGERNTFVVSTLAGKRLTFSLTVQRPDFGAMLARSAPLFLYFVVGLLNLLIGAWVYWRRRQESASLALLLVGVVAAVHAGTVLPAAHAVWAVALRYAIFPFYGPVLLLLALQFTGRQSMPRARLALRLTTAVALICGLTAGGMVLGVDDGFVSRLTIGRGFVVAAGVNVMICVPLAIHAAWASASASTPIALRRRARALGLTLLVSYLWPAIFSLVTFTTPPAPWFFYGNVLSMASLAMFPLLMGYAILRVQMFDVRVVVKRGLVWGGLSLAVLLLYVGLLALAYRAVGQRVTSPTLIGLLIGASVIGFGLLHVRVQAQVNRWFFRSRLVYADAVSRASAELARAQTTEAVIESIRRVLVRRIGFSRVYLAHWSDLGPVSTTSRNIQPDARLTNHELAYGASAADTYKPEPMPATLDPLRVAPVLRALNTRSPSTAFDAETLSCSMASLEDPSSEVGFFRCYGLECLIPLLARADDGLFGVLGFLALGPKRDGHAMDDGERELLDTLANQAALALESSRAFEALQALKDSLEEKVVGRTRELREALAELADMQSQLVESEKQASLARMLSGIVHEVNSPLGVISSSAESVGVLVERLRKVLDQYEAASDDASGAAVAEIDAKLRSRARRALDAGDELSRVMGDSSARLNQVFDGLRRFVSLDEGSRKVVDLREGLEGALVVLASQLAAGQVEVARDFPDEPLGVVGNPSQLNQVFFNLLQNAVAAIEDDKGQISVRARVVDGMAEVVVEDSGRGIPADELEPIFEFGFKRRGGGRVGMRMGLPFCKRVVDELGGSIEIASELGKGTRVVVRLPRVGVAEEA